MSVLIHIDNKPFQVKAGQNLLHAALSSGVDVPYFCWHPALGSAGACRQCAVQIFKDENDTVGRMVMSCMTPAMEGSRISVEHAGCKEFRSDVIEWMMTNHPHDCPICDEGGECHLQDMTVMTGHNYRQFRFKKRTFKNQNLGPFIHHEMNRCITCYRCVRFYKDLAGGTDLSAFSSSNHVYFGRAEDGTLESEFSGNLVEVCPTGVFTDKPFKYFFNRKWDLQMAPSVCQLCSVGCNIIPGERYGSLRRVQNRYNSEVNGYFLCDRGRFGHSFVNNTKRLLVSTGELGSVPAGTIGIGSARASLEANFALRQLVGPENFYDGLSNVDSVLTSTVTNVLKQGRVSVASVQDIEQSDSIWVIGEDLTQTAPRLALAVRQSVFHQAQAMAGVSGIDTWHDIAVRNRVKDKSDGVMITCAYDTRLDDVVPYPYRAHPNELVKLTQAVAHEINQQASLPDNLSEELRVLSGMIAAQLRQAKAPVLISGVSLQSPELIEATANVAWALAQTNPETKIALVMPGANSIGLSMMQPKPMSELPSNIGTMIVLENDLRQRIPKAKRVVVLDNIQTMTTSNADVVIAVKSFAESTGTLVNYEGRVQRYYSVFDRKEELQDAWRVLSSHQNLDEITRDMCETFDWLKAFQEKAYSSHFQIDKQRIPRETLEYSGRTAMVANVTMHEPKPQTDADTPFSHSMEGAQVNVPASLVPFYWSPGWNSVSAVNKYQVEVGGELKNSDGAVKIFKREERPSSDFASAKSPSPASERGLTALPKPAIFGGEERAALSIALSKRMSPRGIELSPKDAERFNLKEGDEFSVDVDGEKYSAPLHIRKDLAVGVALWI